MSDLCKSDTGKGKKEMKKNDFSHASCTAQTSLTDEANRAAGHSHPSADDVLQSHNYERDHVKEFCDRLTIIPQPPSRQKEDESRIQEESKVENPILSLTHHDEIQKWLQDPESRVLVLAGGSDPNQLAGWRAFEAELPPVSGISFVSAKLVQSLLLDQASGSDTGNNGRGTVIPLVCFCTLQRRRWNGILTPTALAMNLLLQLVDRYRDFDSEQMHACIYETAKLTDVCERFAELVLSMRPETDTTLFIVIDGCHELLSEDGGRLSLNPEWETVLAHLEKLIQQLETLNLQKKNEQPQQPTVTVKLLFAGPNATNFHIFTKVKKLVATLDEQALGEIECAWGKRIG